MKRATCWLWLLLAFFVTQATRVVQAQELQAGTYVPNQVFVKMQDGPTTQAATTAHAQVGSTVLKTYDFIGWQLVQLPAGKTVAQAIIDYRA